MRKELGASERKALEDILRDIDPKREYYQLFPSPDEKQGGNLYQVSKQYVVEDLTITAPSLTIENGSISLHAAVKLANKFYPRDKFKTGHMHDVMCQHLFKIADALPGLRYHRSGKIFELILGPFQNANKKKVLSRFFPTELNDIGAVNLNFTLTPKLGENVFNINTVVKVQEQQLSGPFILAVRCDINNRKLAESLEPRDIKSVWISADQLIEKHLGDILDVDSELGGTHGLPESL